jgi:SET domain-containing protein
MIAVRDIVVNEELTYDYGVRNEGERSSDQGQGTRNSEMALESLDREEVKQGGIVETRWQKSTAPFNLTLF